MEQNHAGRWAAIAVSVIGICCITAGVVMNREESIVQIAQSVSNTVQTVSGVSIDYQEYQVDEDSLNHKFYYMQLSEEEKETYKEILQGVIDQVEEITVHHSDPNRTNNIFQMVLDDHPEIFWCDGNAKSVSYTTGLKGEEYVDISPNYTYTGETKETMKNEIEAQAAICLQGIDSAASDYDKIKYIYEYLIDSVEYNWDAPNNQNIYSAMVGKASVCAGYAKSTKYLLERLGIECIYVTGTARDQQGNQENHAWNIVNCGGSYYYVDTTWGDPKFQSEVSEIFERPRTYDYLCCDQNELFRTHVQNEDFTFPVCDKSDLNYYVMNGMAIEEADADTLYSIMCEDIDAEQSYTLFKFMNQESYESSRDTVIEELLPNAAKYLGKWYFLREVRYSYEDETLLNKITIYWCYE